MPLRKGAAATARARLRAPASESMWRSMRSLWRLVGRAPTPRDTCRSCPRPAVVRCLEARAAHQCTPRAGRHRASDAAVVLCRCWIWFTTAPQNRPPGGVSAAAKRMLLVAATRGKIRRSRATMGAVVRSLTTHGASKTTHGAITTSTVGGAATPTNTGTRRMTRALTGAQLSRGRRQACGAWKAATAMRLRCKGPSLQWERRVVLVSLIFAGLSGPKFVG
jgi:hypothetical protein